MKGRTSTLARRASEGSTPDFSGTMLPSAKGAMPMHESASEYVEYSNFEKSQETYSHGHGVYENTPPANHAHLHGTLKLREILVAKSIPTPSANVGMAPRTPTSPVAPNARRGASLLEMLVVIAVSGTILWAAGTLTVSLLNLRSGRRAEHDVQRSLLMLQQQWRTDVRAAKQGAVEEGGTRLSLRNSEGNVVSYRLDGPKLLRTLDDDGHLAGRDEYRLPEGSRVRWLWPKQQGAIATLSIEYPVRSADPRSLRTRTLEAVAGADQRLAGIAGTEAGIKVEGNDGQGK